MAYPSYISSSFAATSVASTFTLDYPTGNTVDDIVVIVALCTDSDYPLLPSGFTDIAVYSGASSTCSIRICWKRCVGGESSVTIERGSAYSGVMAAVMHRFRGCKATDIPYESLKSDLITPVTGDIVISPTAPTGTDRLGTVFGYVEDNQLTTISGSGWSTDYIVNDATGTDSAFGVATKQLNSGDTIGDVTLDCATSFDNSGVISLMFLPVVIPNSPIIGESNGLSTTSAVLSIKSNPIIGVVTTGSSLTGVLIGKKAIVGVSDGITTVTGVLSANYSKAIYFSSGSQVLNYGMSQISIPYPSVVDENDILVIAYSASDDTYNVGVSTPSGWTRIFGANSQSYLGLYAFWKRADGTESGSQTIDCWNNSVQSGVMHSFKGCVETGSPFENPLEQTFSLNLSFTNITSLNPDRLSVAIFTSYEDLTSSIITTTNYIERNRVAQSGSSFILATEYLPDIQSDDTVSYSENNNFCSAGGFYLLSKERKARISGVSSKVADYFFTYSTSVLYINFIPTAINTYGVSNLNLFGLISKVKFRFYKYGYPSYGTITAKIYKINGVNDVTLMATSTNSYNVPSIGGAAADYPFYFDDVVVDYPYVIAITVTGSGHDSNNCIRIASYLYTPSLSPYNRYHEFGSSTYTDDTNYELCYWSIEFLPQTRAVLSISPTIAQILGNVESIASLAGVLTAKGNISATINPVVTSVGLLKGKGNFTGISNGTVSTTGTLIGIYNAIGDIPNVSTTQGTLIGKGNLSGNINASATVVSILENGIQIEYIESIVNGLATINGLLTASGALIGVSNPSLTISGDIKARGKLETVINGNSTVTGQIKAVGKLIGVTNGVNINSGLLNSNLQGSVVVDSTSETFGILTAKGSLVGSSNGSTSQTSSLTSYLDIDGTINGSTTTDGTLISLGGLIGNVIISITNQGTLLANGSLSVTVNGNTTTTALLGAIVKISGESNGSTSLNAQMISNAIISVSNGISTVSGQLSGIAKLFGITNGTSTVSVLISANGTLIAVINTLTIVNATLTGKSNAEASINSITTTVGVLKAEGLLNSVSNGFTETSAYIGAIIQISGASNGIAFVEARAISDAALGITSGQATVFGQLVGKGGLTAIINGTGTVSATLNGLGVNEGISEGFATISGTLLAKGLLNGIVNALATTFGLLVNDAILGVSQSSAIVDGTLSATANLSGSSNGQTTTSSIIDSDIKAVGIINGSTILSGVLVGKGLLLGTSNSIATTNGLAILRGSLVGNVIGITITEGVLIAKAPLVGIISGQAFTEGILINNAIAGIINGTATNQGVLTANGSLSGTINSVTVIEAGVVQFRIIEGVANAFAYVVGTLTVNPYIVGVINGDSSTKAILGKIQKLDTDTFYKVKYLNRGPYICTYKTQKLIVKYISNSYVIRYLTPREVIKYKNENNIVNYQSQNKPNKEHHE